MCILKVKMFFFSFQSAGKKGKTSFVPYRDSILTWLLKVLPLIYSYSTRQKKLYWSVPFNGPPVSVVLPFSRTPHPFNIRLISACVLNPFVRKNGHFGARFNARVNRLSVGRTARELDTKRRILFFHAKGYRAPTITMRADDETTVQEVLGRWSRH